MVPQLRLNVWAILAVFRGGNLSAFWLKYRGTRFPLRRGETVGNATVVEIRETRVIFSVNDFGIRRQGILDLKAKREGA